MSGMALLPNWKPSYIQETFRPTGDLPENTLGTTPSHHVIEQGCVESLGQRVSAGRGGLHFLVLTAVTGPGRRVIMSYEVMTRRKMGRRKDLGSPKEYDGRGRGPNCAATKPSRNSVLQRNAVR